MPVSILVLSLVLLVSGLSGVLLGLSLTPTDMGRAWLDIGFTALTGGVVTLAIGFATRTLTAALERLPGGEGEVARTPEPVAPATLEPSLPVAPAAIVASGVAVAAGAALGAHHLADKTPADSVPVRSVDDLERDLFSDISAQRDASLGAADDLLATPLPEVIPVKAAPALIAEDDAAFELRLSAEPESEPEPTPEPASEPELAPAKEALPAPESVPENPAPAPSTPAGLIADEDLAALVAEEAALAPLDTLEVVGAYDSAGVRFTMYSDGSVNALAPHGERRYRSLEALRKQLDSGLPAV